MRHLPTLIVALVATCLVTTACAGAARSGQGNGPVHYATNGTFTMAVKYDLGPFDPYRSSYLFGFADLAYDSLVNLRRDGTFASGLASAWAADANSATFTLRPDVTCSDGTPLTASQVAADLNYVGDPQNQAAVYGVTVPTVPFTATADDARRVVKIAMRQPFGFALNTFGQAPIMCARGLRDPGLLKSTSDGTGPFVLTGTVPGQSYTLTVRHGYHWGPDGASTSAPGTPATVVLKVVANETTAANLLLSGGLNFAQIAGRDQHRLAAAGLARTTLTLPTAWLWFNHLDGRATADERVRRALVSAVDLGQLVKVSTGGVGTASTGLVSVDPKPCAGNTVAGRLPPHDAAAAGAALDKAGWTKNADGSRSKDGKPLTIDLHYTPSVDPNSQPTAELLAKQWQAIGAQVKLSGDDAATISQVRYQTGNYDVVIDSGGFNLPSQVVPYVSGPVPPTGNNSAHINNGDYNTLTTEAMARTAPDSCAYWNRAEQALFRDVDLVPVSDEAQPFFLRNAQATNAGFALPIPTSIRVLD